MLLQLPDFLQKQVISYFHQGTPEDLLSIFLTCKTLRSYDTDDSVWEYMYHRAFRSSLRNNNLPPSTTWRKRFAVKYYRILPSSNDTIPLLVDTRNKSNGPKFINNPSSQQSVKCVVVGSPTIGKTSLLMTYVNGIFPEPEEIPRVYDNYMANMVIGDSSVNVGLWDTAGGADYDRIRPLSYPPTDVFLFVFSLADTSSLWDIVETWSPEVHHHCPRTKSDIRSSANNNSRCVSTGQGTAVALKIGARVYVECSALTKENVTIVFEQAVLSVLIPENPGAKHKRCNIM